MPKIASSDIAAPCGGSHILASRVYPSNPERLPDTSAGGTATHTALSNASPNVLIHNTAIARKIQTQTGRDAQAACAGFKNLGQCVAAAHVAKNLDIPGGVDALKAKVTGSGAVSLGKAVEQLSPQAKAKAEAKKANKQASDDLQESSS